MQHGEETDLGAQVLRVGGDGAQRLRGCPEQDVVDHGLVLERDGGELLRYDEHHVEVRDVQQLCLAVLQPLGTSEGRWHEHSMRRPRVLNHRPCNEFPRA